MEAIDEAAALERNSAAQLRLCIELPELSRAIQVRTCPGAGRPGRDERHVTEPVRLCTNRLVQPQPVAFGYFDAG